MSQPSPDSVLKNVRDVATRFAEERTERQRRTHLDPRDFARLAEAGYLGIGVPASEGGLWQDVPHSAPLLSELLRALARGDPSVALVCAMHPAVLAYWLQCDAAPEPHAAAWREQRSAIFEGVRAGAWWGTITSEPGSGGDILKTRATARPDGAGDAPHAYRLTGDKHFGSGSGVTSFMLTTARPQGAELPDVFFLDLRGAEWDGSGGVKLISEWDGHGMRATQSHAFRFENFPATRIAWPDSVAALVPGASIVANCAFTAVVFGVVEEAARAAREALAPRHEGLRPYERVEWSRVENDVWLMQRAYEGMLVAAERSSWLDTLRAKTSIAELAEAALDRLCRVVGGSAYARRAPFGQWAQDVRALGHLRPPWGLAFDQLHSLSWAAEDSQT